MILVEVLQAVVQVDGRVEVLAELDGCRANASGVRGRALSRAVDGHAVGVVEHVLLDHVRVVKQHAAECHKHHADGEE